MQRVILAALVLAIGTLGVLLVRQDRRLEQLEEQLGALRTERPASPVATAALDVPLTRPVAASAAGGPAPVPRAQRVEVSRDELARVESAVLDLLETGHPELHAKLRSVVKEEQQDMQRQQREARRERWVARREARLRELSESAGIGEQQREAILTIMLGSRDQIEELRQSAQTPEDMRTLRERVQALRQRAAEQIRKQLTPEQHAAFQAKFEDDDDDRPSPPPGRSE